ncbi:effector-associated constant component EACC1 [Streptomyces rhizosphaerihabitans]|uniref:effector-associated constant component EACC1 n=1 Tax=Streptomyces rhizosphaerihabitans TaxID=1266770 RepID=UPI0021C1D30D|nr:hypothetical protein [Streptomyces rhizosphaerihabitans]MCT9008053.1 hypothetical protein [Streptomyces rhizosphaerihabitans]
MSSIEVVVQLTVEGIDPDHPLVEQAQTEFREHAEDVAGLLIEERSTPVTGQKGALTELAILFTSSRAGSAVVNLIKVWLERDQKRSVEVTVTKPGEQPFTVRASGEKISLSVLEESFKTAVQGAVQQSAAPGDSGD